MIQVSGCDAGKLEDVSGSNDVEGKVCLGLSVSVSLPLFSPRHVLSEVRTRSLPRVGWGWGRQGNRVGREVRHTGLKIRDLTLPRYIEMRQPGTRPETDNARWDGTVAE